MNPLQEHLIIVVFNLVMIALRTRLEESRKIFERTKSCTDLPFVYVRGTRGTV